MSFPDGGGRALMEKRRVVITGIGVVAPNGIGIENFWDSLVQGRSGVRRITHFDASSYPSQIAAEVSDFNPTNYMDPKTAKRLGRFAQFTLAASQMALEDSEIDIGQQDPYRIGVFIGSAIGGADISDIQHNIFMEKGLKRISPYAAISISTHSASGIISCEFNLRGPNTTISSGCNAGLDATYLAYNAINLGDADLMIAGAGEAPITPCTYAIFCASGNLSRENSQPKKAVKPYDLNADGMVLGEGGAIIILEELRHALERRAKIYGEILSYSALNEAFDLFGVETRNGTMALNFRKALEKAQIDIKEIDYINAHGNGILPYDISETEAIKEVFGELAFNIPVTSIKPITGHSISTTGIFQLITSLLAIKHGIVPPTINIENPDQKCDLNYVPNRFLRKEVQKVLVNAHGFGGRLTAFVISHFLSDEFS
jgi:3-oxoacyl-[acyl-carrier-protein] synthase II